MTSTKQDTAEITLIERAREAVSASAFIVGDCASEWTRRYANGRTDKDFALLVGLSEDQIYQRRRVAETYDGDLKRFRDITETPGSILRWSHLSVAVAWPDRRECLDWAEENQSTVAEMKAWRRMQNGDDLTVDADDSIEDGPVDVGRWSAEAIRSASPDPSEDRPRGEEPYSPYGKTAKQINEGEGRLAPERETDKQAANRKQVETWLTALVTTANKLIKAGFEDLARDQLDQLADDIRHGEPATGLDKATIRGAIR